VERRLDHRVRALGNDRLAKHTRVDRLLVDQSPDKRDACRAAKSETPDRRNNLPGKFT
jgi:hypothetical protein